VKELIFKDKQKRESYEIELFLRECNLITTGAPWTAYEHRDHPDYVLFSHPLNQRRLVELTSVYLNDKSVETEHRLRHAKPMAIPYNARKLEAYKNRILRAIERKCKTFSDGFEGEFAILSMYLNEYIAIYLSREELLRLVILRFHQIAGAGPFNQIVLWGGGRYQPVLYYRDESEHEGTILQG
jgi:hypothetical protein